ncbi:LLM class flavin-dependent oxidoreductase [Actinomycetospora sp. CA-084318]|uniref:LLM class flavin-dependent oxidoreductase n=1 Tax=Actinomycetospora sp. CA-084318 TaxID=3239892 RepID=UPI003D9884A4
MELMVGSLAKIDQVDLVRKAEDLGATHFGVGEGPVLFSDPYQFLALAARETSTIKLGTWVTNPLTRLAPTTANSFATLNALAPGRLFMGIGTANNAMRSMGRDVATLRELERSVEVIKGLLAGQRVTHSWRGQDRAIEFLDTAGHWYNIDDPVEVLWAAGGPKSLALAAKHADYVTYCLGPDPDMIGLVRRELDKAVADAGRPPGSVKLVGVSWFYLLQSGETWQDAVDHGFGSAPISSCLTNFAFMQRHVDELGEPIVNASTQAAMAYLGDPNSPEARDYLSIWSKYLKGLDPRHRPLITEELVDYWCLYGTPDHLREKTRLMQEAGVDLVGVMLANPFTAGRDLADIGRTILTPA